MEIKLIRIDQSGVFAFPEGYSINDVQDILIDGKVIIGDIDTSDHDNADVLEPSEIVTDSIAIIENGNIDVFWSNADSIVTATLK